MNNLIGQFVAKKSNNVYENDALILNNKAWLNMMHELEKGLYPRITIKKHSILKKNTIINYDNKPIIRFKV